MSESSDDRAGRVVLVEFMVGIMMVMIALTHGLINFSDFGSSGGPVAGTSGGGGGFSPVGVLKEILYVGLFMFFTISGYFYKPGRSVRENISRRVRKLLPTFVVCIIALPLIVYSVMWISGTDFTLADVFVYNGAYLVGTDFFDTYLGGLPYSYSTPFMTTVSYYFVETVLLACVIFFPMAAWATESDRNTVVAIVLLLLVCAVLSAFRLGFLNVDKAFFGAAFMVFGTFVKRKWALFETVGDRIRTWRHWLLFLLAVPVLVGFAVLFPTGLSFNHSNFGSYGILSVYTCFAFGAVAMFFHLTLSAAVYKVPGVRQLFCFIGRYPFEILLFHTFYVKLAAFLIWGDIGTQKFFTSVPEMLVFMLASVALSVLTAVLIEKAKQRMNRTGRSGTEA